MNRVNLPPLWAILVAAITSMSVEAGASRMDDLTRLPAHQNEPVRVEFGVYILNLLEVDDVEQSVTLDYMFILQWNDPRLADSAMEEPALKNRFGLEDIWHPDFSPINIRSTQTPRWEIAIDGDGNVICRYRQIDTFITPLNLKRFPFDKQTLKIKFLSRWHGPESIKPVWMEDRSGHMDSFSITGWEFEGMSVKGGSERIRAIGSYSREVSSIEVDLKLDRMSSFYVWKVIFPLALIVFMGWTVFWIDPTELAGQLGISSASVITLIAFQLSLTELLPTISYLTRIDIYVLGTSGLVFMALGEAILTARLAKQDKRELSRKIDRIMKIAYPILYLIILIRIVI
jgi:hypothetical protein